MTKKFKQCPLKFPFCENCKLYQNSLLSKQKECVFILIKNAIEHIAANAEVISVDDDDDDMFDSLSDYTLNF